MANMTNIERAKQFLPFSALKGYYTLIKEKEKVIESRKVLSEDELERLQNEFLNVNIGMIVKIKYYSIDHYEEVEGMVSKIDLIYKKIQIVKTEINIKDIIDLKI